MITNKYRLTLPIIKKKLPWSCESWARSCVYSSGAFRPKLACRRCHTCWPSCPSTGTASWSQKSAPRPVEFSTSSCSPQLFFAHNEPDARTELLRLPAASVDRNICEPSTAGQVGRDFSHSVARFTRVTSQYFLNTGVRRQVRNDRGEERETPLLKKKKNNSGKTSISLKRRRYTRT